jgi:hypothetical protein
LVLRQRGLEITHRRIAGDAQYITLPLFSQLVAKPRVATQFIITCHPAVRHVITPLIEHLQALLVSRMIPHLLGHMAFLTPSLVS